MWANFFRGPSNRRGGCSDENYSGARSCKSTRKNAMSCWIPPVSNVPDSPNGKRRGSENDYCLARNIVQNTSSSCRSHCDAGLPPLNFGEAHVARKSWTNNGKSIRLSNPLHCTTWSLGKWKSDIPLLQDISLESYEDNLEGNGKEEFIVFMWGMLQWGLEDRKTAKQRLDDPWLENTLGNVIDMHVPSYHRSSPFDVSILDKHQSRCETKTIIKHVKFLVRMPPNLGGWAEDCTRRIWREGPNNESWTQ
jgi:hypothetical protein